MSEKDEFSPVDTIRRLIRSSRTAALGTQDAETGHPFVSLVTVATAHDGSPLMLLSDLARHTANIKANGHVSLLCDEFAPGDPLMIARVTMMGQVSVSDDPVDRARFLAAQPEAEGYAHFKDFAIYRMAIDAAHLVAGFGRIVSVAAEDILTDCSDAEALIEAEAGAIEHMNTDHADALALYAQMHGDQSVDVNWTMTGLDPDGIDITNGADRMRIPFPERVVTPDQLRAVLATMARKARTGS
ncbi:HugZ family protein [Coralliovum pocilloporae]|uniref:HugZ family pyridoxamine 5'-phosphate oxidase n=1 Tax=Coralliovum pocilloporae TaxID=3066369 RepID=UPI003307890E